MGKDSAIFMVEGGRVLEMVKEHIADRRCVREVTNAMLEELGTDEASVNRFNGVLSGVVFKGEVHPDFCKPKGRYGVSTPKAKTAWAKRFKEQKGYRELPSWIATEFSIPTQIRYKGNGTMWGGHSIGRMFDECGFLFIGENGPYAMWTPDVPAEVAEYLADGYEVEEPEKSFVLAFDGCRRIQKEEWEILVLQHKLKQKMEPQ